MRATSELLVLVENEGNSWLQGNWEADVNQIPNWCNDDPLNKVVTNLASPHHLEVSV